MSHDTKRRWSWYTRIVALDYFGTVLSDFRRSFIDEIKVNSCWISQHGKQFFEVQIFCYGQAFSSQRFSISYKAPRNLHVVRYGGESNAPMIGQELISKKIFCRKWKTSVNCLAGDTHRALTAFPIRWKILVLIFWNFPRRMEQHFPSLWTRWKGQTAAGRAEKELAEGEVSKGIFRKETI